MRDDVATKYTYFHPNSGLCALLLTCVLLICGSVHAQDSVNEIPAGLKADQYYDLAVLNQKKGLCEVARECTKRAITLDQNGKVGARAKLFMQSNIPRYPVSATAERQNIEAFNLLAKNKLTPAMALLEDTIQEYPKFEWPYNNLAFACIMQKRTQQAKTYANKALEINPKYANAWLTLGNAYLLERNFPAAKDAAQRANAYDPDNKQTAAMLQYLRRFQR